MWQQNVHANHIVTRWGLDSFTSCPLLKQDKFFVWSFINQSSNWIKTKQRHSQHTCTPLQRLSSIVFWPASPGDSHTHTHQTLIQGRKKVSQPLQSLMTNTRVVYILYKYKYVSSLRLRWIQRKFHPVHCMTWLSQSQFYHNDTCVYI